jgi:hypothetical protein
MNKSAYAVRYSTLEPLIDLILTETDVDESLGDMGLPISDLETKLASAILYPMEFITDKLYDMVQWGKDVIWEKINYLLRLGVPLKQTKNLTVKLFESLGLIILILEF